LKDVWHGLIFVLSWQITPVITKPFNFLVNHFMQDRMSRSNDPNDYVVHDPLLEKGKEKFNRMVAKQKRRDREWAGKSLT